MVTYSINTTEIDFPQKKEFLDGKLEQARKDKETCSYGVLEQRDSYANITVYEHIYTFKS
jgi:hypothetical protein